MPPDTSIRCAFTQRLSSDSSEAIIGPMSLGRQLRLLEARRLMAADAVKVETAAYQVGYESASQFSREYSRMFGVPPKRDAMGMLAGPVYMAL